VNDQIICGDCREILRAMPAERRLAKIAGWQAKLMEA